ncbi:hypothetical protein ROE7235_00018 [Roseibaca ekhonensis]|uniref:DUF2497 domain-containing protein n=1 Tax=Roseinatronobacter ekhonensis TaxID=254356 RepID=A0A3B0M415_9RHOB|nr:hypothetical protein [Roseibaca ekhonensis]SUZ30300.1 hypothetical protein ROE7235_00018 [Roseibaca ekhonensis]
MTEAMSRHEIEDVLSSIRRLVSHDDRSAQQAPAKAEPSKLVLTSALRVDVADDDRVEAADQERTAPPHNAAPVTDAAQAPETVADAEAGTQNPRPEMRLAQPEFANAPSRAPLLTRIAQAGHLSPTPVASPPVRPAAPLATDAQTTESAPAEALTESITDNALDATLARLEQALSISRTEPPQPAAHAQGGSDHADDAVLDESALEQLVAQIVRQELQGELGERITRNIRKLVRAEVARELEMRNL